jgi:hypothetical protein
MTTPSDEQRRRFERLCALRALYAHRGPCDSEPVISLPAAMRYAESLLELAATDVRSASRSADSTV